jgi:hypothetical protein
MVPPTTANTIFMVLDIVADWKAGIRSRRSCRRSTFINETAQDVVTALGVSQGSSAAAAFSVGLDLWA